MITAGDTLTIFSKQVFNESIKKHAKTAAARALDRGYGFPMVVCNLQIFDYKSELTKAITAFPKVETKIQTTQRFISVF